MNDGTPENNYDLEIFLIKFFHTKFCELFSCDFHKNQSSTLENLALGFQNTENFIYFILNYLWYEGRKTSGKNLGKDFVKNISGIIMCVCVCVCFQTI